MKVVNEEELKSINGGFNTTLAVVLGVVATFIIGIFNGQIKLKWQKLKNTVFKGNSVEKPSIQIHQEDAIMYIKL